MVHETAQARPSSELDDPTKFYAAMDEFKGAYTGYCPDFNLRYCKAGDAKGWVVERLAP